MRSNSVPLAGINQVYRMISQPVGSTENANHLAAMTAAIVTIGTFAKSFVPFYQLGSTPIFGAACLLGVLLIAVRSREILDQTRLAKGFIGAAACLYLFLVANYLVFSFRQVPATYLLGILIFHGLFLLFGFVAASSLRTVFAVLLAQGTIYLIIIVRYAMVNGDLMRNGFLQDVFGIGVPDLITALHQNIGNALSLALLSAFGIGSKWMGRFAPVAVPFVVLFMFHIAARGAIVALVGSLLFLLWIGLWARSKKSALIALVAAVALGAVAVDDFYNFALHDRHINETAPDAISRTIREIQSRNPGFRLPIWERTWDRILSETPGHLMFGRGIGTFPIDEGAGPPDWLLRKSQGAAHYPHNVHLELLYEAGIVGVLLFSILAAWPLLVALSSWREFSRLQRSAISIYIFYLISVETSGSFAFSYDFQFFLAISIGIIIQKRKELLEERQASSNLPLLTAPSL